LRHVDMQASIHNMRGPPRRHSTLFHLPSRQHDHRSPRPPSTSSHHASDYRPEYQLDNLSADRLYHIGSTGNRHSGDRIDRESVCRRTPPRRRSLHASRIAFPRGITGRRVGLHRTRSIFRFTLYSRLRRGSSQVAGFKKVSNCESGAHRLLSRPHTPVHQRAS